MLLRVRNSLKRADTSLLRNTLKIFYNDNYFINFTEKSIPSEFASLNSQDAAHQML